MSLTDAKATSAPSEAEVAWAERVVAALDGAGTDGAVTVDGRMIDKPVADAARQVLALHAEPQA